MKLYKLLPFALAALVFAACSKDSIEPGTDPGNQTNPDENWEANVEGLTINFTTLPAPATRAYAGETESLGTEGTVYKAYVFAREANPGHLRPLTGDWTVIECDVNEKGETVGKEPNEIDPNSKVVTLKNVATFHGVRQGDYVYVIANDPTMTLAKAEAMAHQGMQSEEAIKTYTTTLSKNYLGSLTNMGKKVVDPEVKPQRDNDMPKGQFIMSGKAMIPVAPTLPSNGTVELAIGLDRELAKVDFKALITEDPSQPAYNRVVFKEGDGIAVARIATKTSMFTDREANFYVPSPTCTENWPVNDHALDADGNPIGYSDHTQEGSKLFHGDSQTPIVDWQKGMNLSANFNTTNTPGEIQEYRYTWTLPAAVEDEYTTDGKAIYRNDAIEDNWLAFGNEGAFYAPIFYTTPNYSNNTNAITVICTQATYVGMGEFMFKDFNQALVKALSTTTETIKFEGVGTKTIEVPNMIYQRTPANTEIYIESIKQILGWDNTKGTTKAMGLRYIKTASEDEFNALLAARGIDKTKYNLPGTIDKDPSDPSKGNEFAMVPQILNKAMYDDIMNRLYAAVILQYRLANKGEGLVGDYDATTADPGNRIIKDQTAFYYDPVINDPDYDCTKSSEYKGKDYLPTDYLLFGIMAYGTEKKMCPNAFYIYADKDAANETKTLPATIDLNQIDRGSDARLEYFAKAESFKYYTGMKVYYRADVANYTGNTSNRVTERNMHYQTTGTIQTLGAKNIHDAIYSEENTMKVDVTVNSWKLSINNIPM